MKDKYMNILLSAYACEPNKGSEPGVGWHWAIELARLGHQVWVITRANNQPSIEQELQTNGQYREDGALPKINSPFPIANLHFVYYDLPPSARWWKKSPGGIYLYYLLWQLGAYRVAKSLSQEITFDCVHHITFGVFRQPSFMGFLDIPFILGPLGGGESTPHPLRQSFSLKGHILDWFRDLSNSLVSIDPIMNSVYARSSIIFCKTKATLASIPKQYHDKCQVNLEIGINPQPNLVKKSPASDRKFRILYASRLIYWKGLHLGLKAFAQFHQQMPNSSLTVIGSGGDRDWFHRLAEELQINHAIDWIPWMTLADLQKSYTEHDVFLYPSLHDSSGTVILEALSQGLPVVCLDLGGPGVMVNDSCGRVIATAQLSETDVINSLSEALKDLALNPQLLSQLGDGAFLRSQEYAWDKVVAHLYATLSPSVQSRYRAKIPDRQRG